MSLTCQIKELYQKLVETLKGLYCLSEGQEPPWPALNENDSIECQLATLFSMQCMAADQVVCAGCEVEGCWAFKGFDYARGVEGFWDSGLFNATVNGVPTSTPWNFTSDVGKAAGYKAMIDQINATPGWTVTVTEDASMESTDIVGFEFKYCGPADGAVLTIQRTSGTRDVLTLNANDGTGTFVDDGGDEISNGRQPVGCE
jgi:hypothetical protein